MKQRALMAMTLAAAVALAGCSIDPYTGEEKVSNTGKGAGIGGPLLAQQILDSTDE